MDSETLFKLIYSSAESEILAFNHDGQDLTLVLYHDELDGKIEFKITTSLYFSNYTAHSNSPCYLQLNRIDEDLTVENGVYIAAKDFPEFMDQCRNGLHIAYGLRASRFTYFFKVLGAYSIVIPIQSYTDLRFEIIAT